MPRLFTFGGLWSFGLTSSGMISLLIFVFHSESYGFSSFPQFQSPLFFWVKLMNIEVDDEDVIVVPSDSEDEYFRKLADEYTIPCARCRNETCIGRCELLYAWKRKLLGLDKKKGRAHRG